MRITDSSLRKSLGKPSSLQSVAAFLVDWLTIGMGVFLSLYSAWFLPLGLLLVGSRQRALSNLTHDAAHGNLFAKRRLNDLVSNLFSAFAMFSTVSDYRASHLFHHGYLGENEDPDSAMHLSYGFDDRHPWRDRPMKMYLRLVFNRRSWIDSLRGPLLSLSPQERLQVALWWSAVAGTLYAFLGAGSLSVFLIWFGAKATTYHCIRIFAEFLDHSGLTPGDSLSFSRNLPHTGVLRFLTHPHSDTYHLVHHLHPHLPHYALSSADSHLAENLDYRKAHHCDSYFWGSHSAWACWSGKCKSRG